MGRPWSCGRHSGCALGPALLAGCGSASDVTHTSSCREPGVCPMALQGVCTQAAGRGEYMGGGGGYLIFLQRC